MKEHDVISNSEVLAELLTPTGSGNRFMMINTIKFLDRLTR